MASGLVRAEVPGALAGQRLDRVVAMLADLSRRESADLVTSGAVRVGGAVVTALAHRLREGDDVEVRIGPEVSGELRPDATVEVPTVHVDDDVIVVDKPAGLVVHPGAGHDEGTLVHGLLARWPDVADTVAAGADHRRPGIVHRLDRGTSGLMVVARTGPAWLALSAAIAAREVERRYAALVWRHPQPARGVIDAPLGRSPRHPTRRAVRADGRPSRTGYEVVSTWHQPVDVALVHCRLETGRTHQVRVHLAAIGHPVVGDEAYGGARPALALGRPFLHARELAFDHPSTGERLAFSSPLPADLQHVLDGLS